MSLLTVNSLPASRARGCVFAENFDSIEAFYKNGGTIVTGTPVFGKNNCYFDGASYLRYPIEISSIRSTGPWTLSCFIKPSSTTGYSISLGFGSIALTKLPWIGVGASGFFTTGTYGSALASTIAHDGVSWYHVASTFSSGTTTIYVNGVSYGSSGALVSAIDDSNVYIGGIPGYLMTGMVKRLRIFSVALTSEEIAAYARCG